MKTTTKVQKQVQVLARIQFKNDPRKVVYQVRSSNGADIVKLTNKLAATYLQHNLEDFKVVSECMDSGMSEKDAKRVEAQMLKLIERIRRA